MNAMNHDHFDIAYVEWVRSCTGNHRLFISFSGTVHIFALVFRRHEKNAVSESAQIKALVETFARGE